MSATRYIVKIRDKETGSTGTFKVSAKSASEARQIAAERIKRRSGKWVVSNEQ